MCACALYTDTGNQGILTTGRTTRIVGRWSGESKDDGMMTSALAGGSIYANAPTVGLTGQSTYAVACCLQ